MAQARDEVAGCVERTPQRDGAVQVVKLVALLHDEDAPVRRVLPEAGQVLLDPRFRRRLRRYVRKMFGLRKRRLDRRLGRLERAQLAQAVAQRSCALHQAAPASTRPSKISAAALGSPESSFAGPTQDGQPASQAQARAMSRVADNRCRCSSNKRSEKPTPPACASYRKSVGA